MHVAKADERALKFLLALILHGIKVYSDPFTGGIVCSNVPLGAKRSHPHANKSDGQMILCLAPLKLRLAEKTWKRGVEHVLHLKAMISPLKSSAARPVLLYPRNQATPFLLASGIL